MKFAKFEKMLFLTTSVLILGSSLLLGGCDSTRNTSEPTCSADMIAQDGNCIAKPCPNGDSDCSVSGRCSVEGVCEPRRKCSSDDVCGFTKCIDGACQNPDTCKFDKSCIPGDVCRDEKCIPDPCGFNGCTRGVCNKASGTGGKCVNSEEECTKETEDKLCMPDSRCIINPATQKGKCKTAEEFCGDFPCRRGVCSEERFSCENSPNCGNNNTLCLEGYYCDSGVCKESKCKSYKCSDGRGLCNHSDGSCINPETCALDNECKDGFKCYIVEDSVQSCRKESDPCEGSCTGSQECQVEESSVGALPKVSCIESTTVLECKNTYDCIGKRICNSSGTKRHCIDPPERDTALSQCQSYDTSESSDESKENPRDIGMGVVTVDSVSICGSDDSDYFKYNAKGLATSEAVGVTLKVAVEDVGAGTLTVKIYKKSDSGIIEKYRDYDIVNSKGEQIDNFIFNLDSGFEYIIEVAGKEGLFETGVRYELKFMPAQRKVLEICSDAKEGRFNEELQGNLLDSNRHEFKECGDSSGERLQDVWRFIVEQDSVYQIDVTNKHDNGLDVNLSLRSNCLDDASEIFCVNEGETNIVESRSGIITKGEYYLSVGSQNSGVLTAGEYLLKFNLKPIVCEVGESRCADANKSLVCNADRTDFDEVDCNSGCDSSLGLCREEKGAFCKYPLATVTSSTPYSNNINFSGKKASYQLLSDTCNSGINPISTQGNEVVFEVVVPSGSGLEAVLKTLPSTDGTVKVNSSLYIIEDCSSDKLTCLAGVDKNPNRFGREIEKLSWLNDSGAEKRVFLVVEGSVPRVENYQGKTEDKHIDISVTNNIICTSNQYFCKNVSGTDTIYKCGADGKSERKQTSCPAGCNTEVPPSCIPMQGETCDNFGVLTPGMVHTLDFYNYKHEYNPPQTCLVGFPSLMGKRRQEAVFEFSVEAGKYATFTLTDSQASVDIWITDSCDDSTGNGKCLNAQAMLNVGDFFTFKPEENSTNTKYYLYIQANGSTYSSKVAKLKFELKDLDETRCNQSNLVLGCNTDQTGIEYCKEKGILLTHSCSCSAGEMYCNDRNGDTCFDAVKVDRTSSKGNVTGRFGSTTGMSSYFGRFIKDETGTCYIGNDEELGAIDNVYRFDLLAGETLFVDFKPEGALIMQKAARAYFLDNCLDLNSCSGSFATGKSVISYSAPSDKSVFLVIDSSKAAEGWSFDWEITNANCLATGSSVCKDNNSVYAVSTSGQCEAYTCPTSSTGCTSGYCKQDEDNAKVCGDAIELTEKVNFISWNIDSAGSDFSIDCAESDGPEVFYKVTAKANQRIFVRGQSQNIASLSAYILDSCDVKPLSCRAAANSNITDGFFTLEYDVIKDGVYYIGLDTKSNRVQGMAFAEVRIVEDECDSNYTTNCEENSIKYCFEGKIKSVVCDESSGCSSSKCNNEGGDTCFDAITLNGDQGSLVDQNWDSVNAWASLPSIGVRGQYESVQSGSCLFPQMPRGKEKYYAIDLKKGDVFDVEVTSSNSNVALYILDNCSSQHCVLNTTIFEKNEKSRKLSFVASEDKTYYVVVGIYEKGATFSYSMNWTRSSKSAGSSVCKPLTSWCEDNNLFVCSQSGNLSSSGECATCKEGICEYDSNSLSVFDQCNDQTPVIEGSTVLVLPEYSFSNSYQGKYETCDPVTNYDSADSFFKVKLKNKQVLRVTSLSSDEYDQGYIFRFTGGCDSLATSCIERVQFEAQSGVSKSLIDYRAFNGDEEFVIGVTRVYSGASIVSVRKLLVEIFTPVCEEGELKCDGGELQYCSNSEAYLSYQCSSKSGCEESPTVSLPPGYATCKSASKDTCLESEFVALEENVEKSVEGSLNGLTNSFDMGSTGTSCTGEKTPGPDAVYAIKVPSMKKVTVSVVGKDETNRCKDLALYLTKSCVGLPNTCLVGADTKGTLTTCDAGNSGEETVKYENNSSESELIYVVVDSFREDMDAEYKLTFNLSPL